MSEAKWKMTSDARKGWGGGRHLGRKTHLYADDTLGDQEAAAAAADAG